MEFYLRIEDIIGVEKIYIDDVDCGFEKFHKYCKMQPKSYIDLIDNETGEIIASNHYKKELNPLEISGIALKEFFDNWSVAITMIELN